MNLKTTAEQREEWKSDCEKMCSAGKTEKNLAIYFALVLLEDFESILGKLENSGCMCQGCGDRYALDVIIPDEIWEEIKPYGKPVGAGLLCPNCISSRTVELLEVSKKVREIGQMYCNELKMERDAALTRIAVLEKENKKSIGQSAYFRDELERVKATSKDRIAALSEHVTDSMLKIVTCEHGMPAVEMLEVERDALRGQLAESQRQALCLATSLTENILFFSLKAGARITIDDLWSPEEWLERTKTGDVVL